MICCAVIIPFCLGVIPWAELRVAAGTPQVTLELADVLAMLLDSLGQVQGHTQQDEHEQA